MALLVAVSGAEDPEKMLDQAVNEMQNDLIKMRQAAAQACQFLSGLPAIVLHKIWGSWLKQAVHAGAGLTEAD